MKIPVYWVETRRSGLEEPVDSLEPIDLSGIGVRLSGCPRLLRSPARIHIADGAEPSRDVLSLERGGYRAAHAVADDFRPAGHGAGENRYAGGQRLEMHVPEWLVACGQRHGIGGGVDPLDVRARRYPCHRAVQAEPRCQPAVHLASALARHEESHVAGPERAHGLHQGAEPLALEARADEGDQP